MSGVLVGVDVGGTFTDAVAVDQRGGARAQAKAPTTPEEIPEGVGHAVEQVLASLGAGPEEVERVLHGTTTATNALLEDDLAPTALVTNRGFEDAVEMGRQDRASLYDLDDTGPAPVVPRSLRFGIQARMDARGEVLEPVDPDEIGGLADRLAGTDVDAVAVCLLHAHRSGTQEAQVADRLRERLDGVHVVTSHATNPEFREVARFTTTIVNAALRPRMERYLASLTDRLDSMGIQAPVSVLDSAGALIGPEQAARLPVRMVLSGPAGGAAALARLADRSGSPSLLGVDMGGTSTDVSLVLEGAPSTRWETQVAGRRLQLPAVDVHTIGAGGGSIAWRDDAGGLRVGPVSAGADPGPACYGRGGTRPTLTDANLVLGRIPPGAELGGALVPDRERAREALSTLAGSSTRTVEALASAIVRIANARAVRGIRVLTARHAADPAELAFVPFGGAGPQFGAEWAREMGIPHVIVPRDAGVRSAAGLLAAPPRVERSRSLLAPLAEMDREGLTEAWAPLEEDARSALGVQGARIERAASVRYRGQSHELTVELDAPDPTLVRERFEAQHRTHHGYALPDADVEVVTLRARAVADPLLAPDEGPEPPKRGAPTPATTMETWFADADGSRTTDVFEEEALAPGHRFAGPAIVRGEDTTVLVPPRWSARVDAAGHLHLHLHGEGIA